MELICEKYKEKMKAEDAKCLHPKEYCKFRTSCIITFIEKDKEKEKAGKKEKNSDREDIDDPAKVRKAFNVP